MDELNVANNEENKGGNEVVPNQTNGYSHNTADLSYSEWDVSKGSNYIETLDDVSTN